MLESFFIFGSLPFNVETGSYRPPLVMLSYMVACFASYTALSLAQQVVSADNARQRFFFLWGGAFAMGAGIWSMHFIGMLSYAMRMKMRYDPGLTLLSMVIAIAVAYGVLGIVTRAKLNRWQIINGAILLGLGICAMHYTGMAAMEMDASLRYMPEIFLLSVFIAIIASAIALWMAFTLARHHSRYRLLYQAGAALIMGAGICGMHYTGMYASVFIPFANCRYDPNQNFDMLALSIATITMVILGLALAAGIYRKTQTEFLLANSESKLRAMIDNALDAVISMDEEGNITEWNLQAETIFGWEFKDVVGTKLAELIIPLEFRQAHYEGMRRFIAHGTGPILNKRIEVQALNRRGVQFPVELTVTAQKLRNQYHFTAFVRDIAERKQAEKKLHAAHKYLEDMLNHIPDPIFMKDKQHRWIGGNRAFWEMMNGPPEKFLGKTDYEFFPKAEADVFWEQDDKVFNSGGIDINKESFTDARGLRHTLLTKKIAFIDDKGEQFLVGVINDMTASIAAEEKMALLATIVESSDDAIISKTLDDVITSWNVGATRLFGYDAEQALGQPINLIVPPERWGEEHYITEQLRQGKRVEHYETVRVARDGRRIDVWLTVSALYNPAGEMIGASKIIHDITDRKEVEAQLLRYTKELERSNQELDDFAYIASHDLKEPLRGLFNHSSFLLEDYKGKLDTDGEHRLQRLVQLSQRMEYLVNDLLYFSRLGRTDLAIQDTDPNAIISEIVQMMESFLKERNAHVIVLARLPNIICDRPRVTEVFRNLITNAVKYNDKREPVVEVGFLEEAMSPQGNKKDVFFVKDNGVGIEREFYAEIFRIFKRLQNTEKGESGTGAGLTFVKKIVERHKGIIWLDSEPGKGTTFYFTLK